MIRVLQMIGGLNIGGSQSLVMNLYEAIDRNIVQFDFIIDEPGQMALAEQVRSMGGKIYVLPKFNGWNLAAVRKSWNQFFQDNKEYSILHSHVRSYASIYLPIAKKHGLQTIIHSHNTLNGRGLTAAGKAVLQYPLRFQADYFFACSKIAGEWLFGKRVVAGEKYYMVNNAIDVKKYQFNPAVRARMRQKLGVSDSTVIYGHVGRFTAAKNHVFLLDIFKAIHGKENDSILLLVGDGELYPVIAEKIRESRLESSIKVLGTRSDAEQLLQAMDVFLFPSKWEGFPVSIVEAQAAGLVCYVSNAVTKEVGLSELVTFLPIDQGPEVWVSAVREGAVKRGDVTEKIIEDGFDIHTQAKWIENFYLSVARKMK